MDTGLLNSLPVGLILFDKCSQAVLANHVAETLDGFRFNAAEHTDLTAPGGKRIIATI